MEGSGTVGVESDGVENTEPSVDRCGERPMEASSLDRIRE